MNNRIKIGMTGSRNGMSDQAQNTLRRILLLNDISEAHHGDCVGADTKFHEIVTEYDIRTVIHPPTYDSQRAFNKGDDTRMKKPYLDRNKDIVNESDVLLAFPSSKIEELRSGTWSTIRYGRKQNKEIILIYPDGTYDSNSDRIRIQRKRLPNAKRNGKHRKHRTS